MSGPDSMSELLRRLEDAERESGRVRRMGTLLLGGGAVVLGLIAALIFVALPHGLGSLAPSVIQARRFVLRDAQGHSRGVWGVGDDGAAQILLNDGQGRPRLRLRVFGDGSSGVSLVDASNQSRLVLGVLPDQNITMALADESGKTRAVFGLTPAGAATMLFADRKGVTKAGIGVDQRGLGTLTLVDRALARADETADTMSVEQTADHGAETPPKKSHR